MYVTFLPKFDASTSGLSPSASWPLNQNAAPAASARPATFWPVGAKSGSTSAPPLFGMSSVWKPPTSNLTESPTLIVVVPGKKALENTPAFCRVLSVAAGGPMRTVLVLA